MALLFVDLNGLKGKLDEKFADRKSLRCYINGYNHCIEAIVNGDTSPYLLKFAVKLLRNIRNLESKLGL